MARDLFERFHPRHVTPDPEDPPPPQDDESRDENTGENPPGTDDPAGPTMPPPPAEIIDTEGVLELEAAQAELAQVKGQLELARQQNEQNQQQQSKQPQTKSTPTPQARRGRPPKPKPNTAAHTRGNSRTTAAQAQGESDSEVEDEQDTLPYEIDDQEGDDAGQMASIQDVQSIVGEQMRPLIAQLEEERKRHELARSEAKALRSQVAKLQKQLKVGASAAVVGVQPVCSAAQDASSSAMAAQGNSATPGNSSTPPSSVPVVSSAASVTTLPLPPLTKSQFEAIEKGDYVDFNKLKPKDLLDLSREDGPDGFEVFVSSAVSNDKGTIKMRKEQTRNIRSFAEWSEVWHMFLAARLHFRPEESQSLLAYQGSITRFARIYRFNAVYAYDISFRKQLAAERCLGPAQKTVRWEVEHAQLMNMTLYGNMQSAMTCFKCSSKDHMAAQCPAYQQGLPQRSASAYRNNGGAAAGNRHPQQPWFSFRNAGAYQQSQQHAPQGGSNRPRQNVASVAGNGAGGPKNNGVCNNWNHKGHCFRGPTCPFKHICNKCSKPTHGGINCDQSSTTNFVPAQPAAGTPSTPPAQPQGGWTQPGSWMQSGPWPQQAPFWPSPWGWH